MDQGGALAQTQPGSKFPPLERVPCKGGKGHGQDVHFSSFHHSDKVGTLQAAAPPREMCLGACGESCAAGKASAPQLHALGALRDGKRHVCKSVATQ